MMEKILFRSHNFADLCGSVARKELTELQCIQLDALLSKENLSVKQQGELEKLITKRDAKPELDATGKKLVEQMFNENVRGTYTHKVESDYLKKGLEMENHAIARIARVNGWGICVKYSGAELQDEIGTGNPDVYKINKYGDKLGFDAKSSFTDASFPAFKKKITEARYIWQAKRYCMLTGTEAWYVCYSLENSPEPVVIDHAWKLWREAGCKGQLSESFIDDVRGLHTFDHLPDWARVKTFEVKLTEADREFAKKRAELGQLYYNELLENYNENNWKSWHKKQ